MTGRDDRPAERTALAARSLRARLALLFLFTFAFPIVYMSIAIAAGARKSMHGDMLLGPARDALDRSTSLAVAAAWLLCPLGALLVLGKRVPTWAPLVLSGAPASAGLIALLCERFPPTGNGAPVQDVVSAIARLHGAYLGACAFSLFSSACLALFVGWLGFFVSQLAGLSRSSVYDKLSACIVAACAVSLSVGARSLAQVVIGPEDILSMLAIALGSILAILSFTAEQRASGSVADRQGIIQRCSAIARVGLPLAVLFATLSRSYFAKAYSVGDERLANFGLAPGHVEGATASMSFVGAEWVGVLDLILASVASVATVVTLRSSRAVRVQITELALAIFVIAGSTGAESYWHDQVVTDVARLKRFQRLNLPRARPAGLLAGERPVVMISATGQLSLDTTHGREPPVPVTRGELGETLGVTEEEPYILLAADRFVSLETVGSVLAPFARRGVLELDLVIAAPNQSLDVASTDLQVLMSTPVSVLSFRWQVAPDRDRTIFAHLRSPYGVHRDDCSAPGTPRGEKLPPHELVYELSSPGLARREGYDDVHVPISATVGELVNALAGAKGRLWDAPWIGMAKREHCLKLELMCRVCAARLAVPGCLVDNPFMISTSSRSILAASLLLCATLPISCGGSDDTSSSPDDTGGAGTGGTSSGAAGTTGVAGHGASAGSAAVAGHGGSSAKAGASGSPSHAGAGGSTSHAGTGGSTSQAGASGSTGTTGGSSAAAGGDAGGTSPGGTSGMGVGGNGTAGNGTSGTGGNGTGGGPTVLASGWLYTSGNQILVADGNGGGKVWMGRGVNLDDLYLCGNNYHLDDSTALGRYQAELTELVANWKPNFLRVSLGMNSYPVKATWTSDNAIYKSPMTTVIEGLGANPGTYVLVTLRSDVTMAAGDSGDPEPTGVPAPATDAVYTAIVDSFANDGFVLFGLSNEPGGNAGTEDEIRTAMDHAVGTIRAHEDAIGAPHHIVSVQANGYTGNASMWASQPLSYDNVVYEVHGYPPSAKDYTFSNIPVIIGEYGGTGESSPPDPSLFDDFETKQLPNLAWDYEEYSDCGPDLLDTSKTGFVPTPWGQVVKKYLTDHAQ